MYITKKESLAGSFYTAWLAVCEYLLFSLDPLRQAIEAERSLLKAMLGVSPQDTLPAAELIVSPLDAFANKRSAVSFSSRPQQQQAFVSSEQHFPIHELLDSHLDALVTSGLKLIESLARRRVATIPHLPTARVIELSRGARSASVRAVATSVLAWLLRSPTSKSWTRTLSPVEMDSITHLSNEFSEACGIFQWKVKSVGSTDFSSETGICIDTGLSKETIK